MAENDWEDVKKPAAKSAGADSDWEDVPHGATATAVAEPPSDEEIESAYPDAGPELKKAVKTGVTKMTPPTQFEKERAPLVENFKREEHPELQEYLGLPSSHTVGAAYEGAKGLVGSALQGAYDVGLGQVNPETGELEHGIGGLAGLNTKGEFAPVERAGAIARKYITDPAVEQWNKAKEEKEQGHTLGAIGHAGAAALPLVGPWVAHLGERAGTGDVSGAAGEAAGTIGAGELIPKLAKQIPGIADKIARGTPLTEEGKIVAAKEQALTVKKPSMTETEYAAKVNDAMPDLQRIAQDNKGQIKTPRQAAGAMTNRIAQMEAPISEHLAALPENMPENIVHPEDYRNVIDSAMDRELAKHPGEMTEKEMEAAKKKVGDFIGDQPKSLLEIEGNRRRLNSDAQDYFNARPADKRVMDASDATAIAQRAAADAIRDELYGNDTNPGLLEKAGVTAVDQEGNPVSMRDFRKKVGNLIEVRNHFEDAITRAENAGDWKAFDKWRTGPSLAAGGLGAIGGFAAGGPFGAILGTLAGEGVKAWGDYLRSKNVNLNVQKMFRNLEQTRTPNVARIQVGSPITPRVAGLLPAIGESSAPAPVGALEMPGAAELAHPEMFPHEPIGVEAPRQVYREPETGRMQRGFKGEMPPRIVGATAEGGPMREPVTPIAAPIRAPEPLSAPQRPIPEGEGLLPRLQESGKRGILGTIGELQKSGVEKLSVGDTFVDETGEPRRIVDIKDGKIETADGTKRTYEDEVGHLGEINSPRAQLARGGKLIPATEPQTIQDMWLVGRARSLESQGLSPREAVIQATKDWQEQSVAEHTRMNASGESAASLEAQNRTRGEQARGIGRVKIDTRSGQEIPLRGVDAVDVKAGPYDEIVMRDKEGNETVLDRGARARIRGFKKPTVF